MPDKILIVDDDIESLKLIGLMLKRNGYEIVAANSGRQALSKVEAEFPDLIILDVMMPDMNGYEVCRRIKSNEKFVNIPIIMFTAKTLIDDKVAGFEAGADDYLTKPTHPAELAARIKSILDRSPTPESAPQVTETGKSIGIIGAKGGIGTTTIAVNIASTLSKKDAKPIIVDLQLGNGSMGLQLGFRNDSGMANILTKSPEEITPETIQKSLATHRSGFKLLLSSARPKEAQLNIDPAKIQALMKSLKTLGNPILYDLGTRYTPINAAILKAMDRIIMVVEPTSVTLNIGKQLIEQIAADTQKRIDIIVVTRNQSKQQIPWHEVEEKLSKEILAIVSSAPDIAFQAAESGMPIVDFKSSAIVSSQMSKLSEDIFNR